MDLKNSLECQPLDCTHEGLSESHRQEIDFPENFGLRFLDEKLRAPVNVYKLRSGTDRIQKLHTKIIQCLQIGVR